MDKIFFKSGFERIHLTNRPHNVLFSAFTNLVAFTSYYDEDEEKVDSEDDDDDGRQRNPLALLAQIISKVLVILYSGVLTEYNDSALHVINLIIKPLRYVGSVAG